MRMYKVQTLRQGTLSSQPHQRWSRRSPANALNVKEVECAALGVKNIEVPVAGKRPKNCRQKKGCARLRGTRNVMAKRFAIFADQFAHHHIQTARKETVFDSRSQDYRPAITKRPIQTRKLPETELMLQLGPYCRRNLRSANKGCESAVHFA